MALIKCKECEKEVSSKALSCPGCGAPIQGGTQSTPLWNSLASRSSPQEVVVRGTDVGYEAQKLTEKLIMAFLALFLHPFFSLVGFWLLCFLVLFNLAPVLGVSSGGDSVPAWYGYSTAVAAAVPAVIFRKFVPTLMKWVLIIGGVVLAILVVISIASAA